MSARWQFYDPVSTERVDFEINPNEGGTPELKKNILTQVTTAPGVVVLQEGRDVPQQGTFTGTLLTESQLAMFNEWFSKRWIVEMTDDLNRTFEIYITGVQVKRERAVQYPWKHSYTVNYVVVNEL